MGRKPGAKNKVNTEERIILSAAKLFVERGVVNVSIKDIAAVNGVTSALVHNKFPAPTIICICKRITHDFFGQLQSKIMIALDIVWYIEPVRKLQGILALVIDTFQEQGILAQAALQGLEFLGLSLGK